MSDEPKNAAMAPGGSSGSAGSSPMERELRPGRTGSSIAGGGKSFVRAARQRANGMRGSYSASE